MFQYSDSNEVENALRPPLVMLNPSCSYCLRRHSNSSWTDKVSFNHRVPWTLDEHIENFPDCNPKQTNVSLKAQTSSVQAARCAAVSRLTPKTLRDWRKRHDWWWLRHKSEMQNREVHKRRYKRRERRRGKKERACSSFQVIKLAERRHQASNSWFWFRMWLSKCQRSNYSFRPLSTNSVSYKATSRRPNSRSNPHNVIERWMVRLSTKMWKCAAATIGAESKTSFRVIAG